MLGKRTPDDHHHHPDAPSQKCARTEASTLLEAVQRCARDLNIQGLTDLLQRDPDRTTELLRTSEPTRGCICRMFEHVFNNKLPEDYLYFFATAAMLPWKRLLADALQRGWITSDDWSRDDDLVMVPLFADIPAYKIWLAEQVRTQVTFAVLSAVTFASGSIVEWAYQHNNIELLEWCHSTRVGVGVDTTKPLFSEAYWQNHDSITGDDPAAATADWWRANVSKYLPGEMSGSPGGSDDDDDDVVDLT